MEVDGDPACVLWRHPILLHVPCTKDGAIPSYFPLTTLTTETLQVYVAFELGECINVARNITFDRAKQ